MIAVANIWIFFYTPDYGLINQALQALGGKSQNFLGNPDLALMAVTVVAIWKEAGFFMIFYLAALQTLSPSYQEAAQIEGASKWYFFWRIQWPLLMPTTIFVLVNALINAFRLVDHIFVMTMGGPNNASSLLLYYLYEVGFKFWDRGYASALTVVLLAILAAVGLAQFFLLDKRTHYR
jgi:sn-glycerol 3-phosphate transport system permease protein